MSYQLHLFGHWICKTIECNLMSCRCNSETIANVSDMMHARHMDWLQQATDRNSCDL